jgi:hypothetical protein
VPTRKTKIGSTLALLVLLAGASSFSERSHAVPSFARQTGLACQACHTVFPELTPFGRSFKLNGYQIDNLPQVQGITQAQDYALLLNQLPPLSIMFQASYTRTQQPLPDSAGVGHAQDGQLLFPQQASLFYAGRIAPGLGAFIQATYDSASGNLHWDNTDIRYAKQAPAANPLTWGITANNNPTVQDPWNSTPAWQTPFDQRSNAAPVPGAAAMIDGVLTGKGVAGVTAYAWWMNSVYAELGLYRSSPQGFQQSSGLAGPLDSAVPGGVLTSNAPYWRLAYEHQWDRNALSIGTYGIVAKLSPEGQAAAPPSDRFRDIAFDGQYQYLGDEHLLSLQSTYIKEHQNLDASSALLGTNPSNDLKTFRIAGSYYYERKYGASLGHFSTSGTSDAALYPASPTFGFANGSPDSSGWIGEISYIPWENVKLLAQYTRYSKFNGASTNYDTNGRNAKDNNTLYLLAWLAF